MSHLEDLYHTELQHMTLENNQLCRRIATLEKAIECLTMNAVRLNREQFAKIVLSCNHAGAEKFVTDVHAFYTAQNQPLRPTNHNDTAIR